MLSRVNHSFPYPNVSARGNVSTPCTARLWQHLPEDFVSKGNTQHHATNWGLQMTALCLMSAVLLQVTGGRGGRGGRGVTPGTRTLLGCWHKVSPVLWCHLPCLLHQALLVTASPPKRAAVTQDLPCSGPSISRG